MLLLVCLLAGRMIGGAGVAHAALVFVGLWLVAAAVNLWFGVARAGYSVSEEIPFFFVVFLIPAAVALFVWWRYSRP